GMTVADQTAVARSLGISYRDARALPRRLTTERRRYLAQWGVYALHGSVLLLGTSPPEAWLTAIQKRRALVRTAINAVRRARANGIKLGVLSVDQIAELEAVEETLHESRPVSVCPWCKMLPIDCSGCLGARWISEATF